MLIFNIFYKKKTMKKLLFLLFLMIFTGIRAMEHPKASNTQSNQKNVWSLNPFDKNALYPVLGVPRTADQNIIKESYKKLSMMYHPDRNPGNPGAEANFKAVSDAYDILGNPQVRAFYDEMGYAAAQNFLVEENKKKAANEEIYQAKANYQKNINSLFTQGNLEAIRDAVAQAYIFYKAHIDSTNNNELKSNLKRTAVENAYRLAEFLYGRNPLDPLIVGILHGINASWCLEGDLLEQIRVLQEKCQGLPIHIHPRKRPLSSTTKKRAIKKPRVDLSEQPSEDSAVRKTIALIKAKNRQIAKYMEKSRSGRPNPEKFYVTIHSYLESIKELFSLIPPYTDVALQRETFEQLNAAIHFLLMNYTASQMYDDALIRASCFCYLAQRLPLRSECRRELRELEMVIKSKRDERSENTVDDAAADNELYDLLRVPSNASYETIKEAFDRIFNGIIDKDSEQAKKVSEAYRVLTDSETRKIYDIHGLKAVYSFWNNCNNKARVILEKKREIEQEIEGLIQFRPEKFEERINTLCDYYRKTMHELCDGELKNDLIHTVAYHVYSIAQSYASKNLYDKALWLLSQIKYDEYLMETLSLKVRTLTRECQGRLAHIRETKQASLGADYSKVKTFDELFFQRGCKKELTNDEIQKLLLMEYSTINRYSGQHQEIALKHYYKITKKLLKEGSILLAYATVDAPLAMQWQESANNRLFKLRNLKKTLIEIEAKQIEQVCATLKERIRRRCESLYTIKRDILDTQCWFVQFLDRIEGYGNRQNYEQQILELYYDLGYNLIECDASEALMLIKAASTMCKTKEWAEKFASLKHQAEFMNDVYMKQEEDNDLISVDFLNNDPTDMPQHIIDDLFKN